VHIDDLTGFVRRAIEQDKISGVYNVTSPNPVTNKDFGSTLGKVLGRPSLFPVPGFALKAALGEFGEILLTGQRVIPERALTAGFKFKYLILEDALRSIL
jgi:NAD dependent epimerase/dehydratase family enzyme